MTATTETTEPPISEAGGCCSALRRGHQRRRRTSRAVHRRTAGAACRGRSPDHACVRLHHVAERAPGRRGARSTASSSAAFPCRAPPQRRRVRPSIAVRLRAIRTRSRRNCAGSNSQGPRSPALVRHIARTSQAEFDFFIFFSFRYYHAYHGARAVPDKAMLVPTAERDPVLGSASSARCSAASAPSCTTRTKSAR